MPFPRTLGLLSDSGGGRYRFIVLAIVMTRVFMADLDTVALNIALPDIASNFQVTIADT